MALSGISSTMEGIRPSVWSDTQTLMSRRVLSSKGALNTEASYQAAAASRKDCSTVRRSASSRNQRELAREQRPPVSSGSRSV